MFKNKFKTLIFSLGIFLALIAVAAVTTYTGNFIGNFSGNGSGITNIVTSPIVYVATTGNDANNGSITAPFFSLTNANVLNVLSNNGTVYVRDGSYQLPNIIGAGLRGKISGYLSERPQFWFTGASIPSGNFFALTNGIYTNRPSVLFSNILTFATNALSADTFHPNGIPLYQSNQVYGTQGSNNFYQLPLMFGDYAITNRCPIYTLLQAATTTQLQTNDGLWMFTNGTLFVKFAVSNIPAQIFIPSTNVNDCFISGCDSGTYIQIENIQVFGAWHAFDLTGAGYASIKRCLAGCSLGFDFGSVGNPFGGIDISDCEAFESMDRSFNFSTPYNNLIRSQLHINHCYIHDYFDEALSVRQNITALIENTTAYAGTNGFWAYICDGANVAYNNCKGITQSHAPWQIGVSIPLGHKSTIELMSCLIGMYSSVAQDGIVIADQNDTINLFGCIFDNPSGGQPINVTSSSGTHNVQTRACFATAGEPALLISTDAGLGSPQYSSGMIASGDTVPFVGMFFDGRVSPDGIISETRIRSTTGYATQVGGHIYNIINSSGALLAPGGATVTNGYASFETNTLTVTATGLTNNTTVDYLIAITAGTGLVLKDQNGTQFLTPVLNASYPLKPGWKLTGTLVTGTAIQYP